MGRDGSENEEVDYALDDWGLEQRVLVDGLLTSIGVPHAWQGGTLTVRAADEEAVDRVIDDLDLTSEPAIAPDAERVGYEVSGWTGGQAAALADRLGAEGIAYEWDELGDLVVAGADEGRVDEILDAIERGALAIDGANRSRLPAVLDTENVRSQLSDLMADPTQERLARLCAATSVEVDLSGERGTQLPLRLSLGKQLLATALSCGLEEEASRAAYEPEAPWIADSFTPSAGSAGTGATFDIGALAEVFNRMESEGWDALTDDDKALISQGALAALNSELASSTTLDPVTLPPVSEQSTMQVVVTDGPGMVDLPAALESQDVRAHLTDFVSDSTSDSFKRLCMAIWIKAEFSGQIGTLQLKKQLLATALSCGLPEAQSRAAIDKQIPGPSAYGPEGSWVSKAVTHPDGATGEESDDEIEGPLVADSDDQTPRANAGDVPTQRSADSSGTHVVHGLLSQLRTMTARQAADLAAHENDSRYLDARYAARKASPAQNEVVSALYQDASRVLDLRSAPGAPLALSVAQRDRVANLASDTALAYLTKERLTPTDFERLTYPWTRVLGDPLLAVPSGSAADSASPRPPSAPRTPLPGIDRAPRPSHQKPVPADQRQFETDADLWVLATSAAMALVLFLPWWESDVASNSISGWSSHFGGTTGILALVIGGVTGLQRWTEIVPHSDRWRKICRLAPAALAMFLILAFLLDRTSDYCIEGQFGVCEDVTLNPAGGYFLAWLVATALGFAAWSRSEEMPA